MSGGQGDLGVGLVAKELGNFQVARLQTTTESLDFLPQAGEFLRGLVVSKGIPLDLPIGRLGYGGSGSAAGTHGATLQGTLGKILVVTELGELLFECGHELGCEGTGGTLGLLTRIEGKDQVGRN